MEMLKSFWKEFSINDIHDYDYYVVGSYLSNKKSNDLDIVVTGKLKNNLKSIFVIIDKIAKEKNIPIHFWWQEDIAFKKNRNMIKLTVHPKSPNWKVENDLYVRPVKDNWVNHCAECEPRPKLIKDII